MSVVTVNPRRPIGALNRGVFGGFVEHLGRCIYGGIYDEGSPLSDSQGFRKDVLDLLRDLRVSVLRWPGGNFVSNYHWQDGIGPKDERPIRSDLAWSGTESNRFGTDEYLAYCAALGAEPYICLNMGTGTLEEALAWVEYCNGARATQWAELRRRNGHEEPYGVTWWGLGNEIYGEWQVGALSVDEYVAEARRWARAIRMIDPKAKLVSCGELGWTDWDRQVIDELVSLVDLHSIHIYSGTEEYWPNVLAPHNAERAIEVTSSLIRKAAYQQGVSAPPRIVYDEWNVWYRNMTGALEERFVFSDALAVGTYLNVFVRHCDWVVMANLAQMVNAIAPIVTGPDQAAVQPIYYPILLHAHTHLSQAVDVHVTGERVDAPEAVGRWPYPLDDLGPFDLVDVAASTNTCGTELGLTLVNRSEGPERVEIRLDDLSVTGPADVHIVTDADGPDPGLGLAPARVEEFAESPVSGSLSLHLPARSFAAVSAPIGPR